MQKKIIALAVAGLMSGAAFAQTNVTISGLLDVGVLNAKNEGQSRSLNASYNNTATSFLGFRAQEDLGGGMNAGVYFETDARGGNVAPANTLNDFQRYIWIGGNFGQVSLGQRTNFSTTTLTTAQPFGTAMGGGWGGGFTRTRGGGFEATGAYAAAGRDVRAEGSVRYDSPNFSGMTFGVSWKPENDGNNETAASSGHLNLGLNYGNGPLKVSYAYMKIGNAVAGYDSSTKHNMLAANYSMGMFTIYGGYTTSKADTAAAAGNEANSRSWNIAAKFAATSNVDVLVNYLKDNDKTAANADRKLLGLGVDYKMSKRTAAYVRYDNFDTNTNAAGGKVNRYGAGLRHSF